MPCQSGGNMENSHLVHQLLLSIEGGEYLVEVYSRADGRHFARTAFSPQDVIISDGFSLDEALLRHRNLLPLAIHSRQLHCSSRLIN